MRGIAGRRATLRSSKGALGLDPFRQGEDTEDQGCRRGEVHRHANRILSESDEKQGQRREIEQVHPGGAAGTGRRRGRARRRGRVGPGVLAAAIRGIFAAKSLCHHAAPMKPIAVPKISTQSRMKAMRGTNPLRIGP